MPAITVTVTLRIPPELLEVIDSCRGGVSRNEWMTTALQWAYANRGAVERALEEPSVERLVGRLEGNGIVGPAPAPAEKPDTVAGLLGDPRPGHMATAGPYRQHVPGPNVENVRSSAQAKREFTPYPKGGK